jgi:hypothetical protein
MGISEDVHEAGCELSTSTSETITATINRVLTRFIGDRFNSAPGYVFDRAGKCSETFPCIIYLVGHESDEAEPKPLPADAVAAVVDACAELTLEGLRGSYQRIAEAKSLTKSPVPDGETRTNITLGIVAAARTAVPLEAIAEELDLLNRQTPDGCWPDMVTIASTGVINYAVQFPGEAISAISCLPQRVR